MTTDPKSGRPVGAVGSTPQTTTLWEIEESFTEPGAKLTRTFATAQDAIAEQQRIVSLGRLLADCEAALREIWNSVPATYDPEDKVVQRHSAALRAIPAVLAAIDAMKAAQK
jgi:hypothetical protein